MAQGGRGKAPVHSAGEGCGGIYGGRHSGSPDRLPEGRGHHRRPAYGRHEHGWRAVRLRQDVPPAGGEDRPNDEEGGGNTAALHRSRQEGGNDHSRQGADGNRQGRRTRHRQEHRVGGDGVQQLRSDRPWRNGSCRADCEESRGGEGGHDRAERSYHAESGRDGERRHGDGACRTESADNGGWSHHVGNARGAEDCPHLQRHRGLGEGCGAEPHNSAAPHEPRGEGTLRQGAGREVRKAA